MDFGLRRSNIRASERRAIHGDAFAQQLRCLVKATELIHRVPQIEASPGDKRVTAPYEGSSRVQHLTLHLFRFRDLPRLTEGYSQIVHRPQGEAMLSAKATSLRIHAVSQGVNPLRELFLL